MMQCCHSFVTPKTPRKCNSAIHKYTFSAEPVARAVQYISRLFDRFGSGVPVFLLDCLACKREDAGFQAVVKIGCEDDVFVLVAVGELCVY